MHAKHALSFKGSLPLWPTYIHVDTDVAHMINAPSQFLHTAKT